MRRTFEYGKNEQKNKRKPDRDTSKRNYDKSERDYDRPKRNYRKQERETELVRLNRFIANSGICSRREADELIASGAVSVNGKVVKEMGYKVSPKDEVRYKGKKLSGEKKVYIVLNKPKDFITTTDDERGRKTVMDLVKNACRERIYPVGRLDRNTTGVLLLTNDGELAKTLTHPSYGAKKIYHVELNKRITNEDIKLLLEGVELEDGKAWVDEIQIDEQSNNARSLGVEIHSGRNRIVRRLFESLGYEVVKLDRTSFAGLTKRDISRGQWRHLEAKEVGFLKMIKRHKD
jgi:23S rRNA pseudouridine2605 synthase